MVATLQNDATGSGTGSSGAVAPANTVAPVASGTMNVGQTLTTTTGTWTGSPTPTFTYQWQRDAVNITSATASTYVLTISDAASTIRCVVTATNVAGSASANSNGLTWTPFVNDTFTDTNGVLLSSHTGETGASYTVYLGTAMTEMEVQSNRLARNSTFPAATPAAYASGVPATANYRVDANVFCASNLGEARLMGRVTTGADTKYWVGIGASGGVRLFKTVAGVNTQLGSTHALTPSASTTYKITLRMSGTSIEALLDDVVVVGPITDSAISAKGLAGVYFSAYSGTSTTGMHFDRIWATG